MLRVRVNWSGFPGTPYVSTHYFKPPVEDQTAANAAVSQVAGCWNQIDPRQVAGITWATEAIVARITDAGVLVGQFATAPQTSTGALVGDWLPRMTQGLLTFHTGVFVAGREIRGKMFVPALTETDNTAAGAPSTTLTTAINLGGLSLLGPAACPLAVWSRTHSTSAIVTIAAASPTWALLRSRRD